MLIFHKFLNLACMRPDELGDHAGRAVSQLNPNHLWWSAKQETVLMKIRVLADDCEVTLRRILPNRSISGGLHPNIPIRALTRETGQQLGRRACARGFGRRGASLDGGNELALTICCKRQHSLDVLAS